MLETAEHCGPDDPLTEKLDRLLQDYAAARYTEAELEEQKRKDEGVVSYRDFLRFGPTGRPPLSCAQSPAADAFKCPYCATSHACALASRQ